MPTYPAVRVRRFASYASTIVVAIVVALAVPISQLRTISVVASCCCPDPSNCHCPDHKPDHCPQSSMNACHRSQQTTVAPQLPAFEPPVLVATLAPVRPVVPPAFFASLPHDPPSPARPDAPS